jgi:hypothetical protein
MPLGKLCATRITEFSADAATMALYYEYRVKLSTRMRVGVRGSPGIDCTKVYCKKVNWSTVMKVHVMDLILYTQNCVTPQCCIIDAPSSQ